MPYISTFAIVIIFIGITESANADCGFVSLDNHSPIGQSLYHITKNLGGSGYSRLPDEDFWSFEKSEINKIGVVAPLADLVAFGTYKNIIFQSNLRFQTKNLNAARFDLAHKLDSCAKKIRLACWKDESGSFYEIGADSKDTYLYITSPQHGSPNDPDLPSNACR